MIMRQVVDPSEQSDPEHSCLLFVPIVMLWVAQKKRERKNKSGRGEGGRGECRREGGGIKERKKGRKDGREGERDKSGSQLMFVP